jgi:acyl-[acyl-carrier-protein]-phospholipid O-acyltransferase/long-chain-fatty-acid--[acyl-carrier-protein] ligase
LYKKKLEKEKTVAIMMPNTVTTSVLFFALQNLNKTASIINFTSCITNIKSSLEVSKIKIIITSKNFIEQINMQENIKIIEKNTNVLYVEDIKSEINISSKIEALKKLLFKEKIERNENNVAVILYTSGTEGSPKGVMLTHKNLYENRKQILNVLNIQKGEKFFTCLPFFHSFGLGVGVLLPILNNFKVFLYPTPLHYKNIPGLIESTGSSVFFSTDTFLKKYSKYAVKENFKNIKYLIAGAEKLDEETYTYYKNNFDTKILEGYGVTESSPAVSVNTFEDFKLGSVGKIFSEIEYKIEKIDGYSKGGLLFLKGKNIMLGYQVEKDTNKKDFHNGWYNTGDVAFVDNEGYLFILGRLKRFAKIAGEMISLAQVENFPKKLWPENYSAVCNVKDVNKGETLILLTDNKKADLIKLMKLMKEEGQSSLYFPKKIKIIDEFPILGSGKIDFKKLQELAES